MYQQKYILTFILISMSLHVAVLSQYKFNTAPVFNSNNKLISVELSSFSSPAIAPKKTYKKHTPKVKNKPITKKSIRKINKTNDNIKYDTTAKNEEIINKPTENIESDASKELKQTSKAPSDHSVEKNKYLKLILTAIEKNKFYPSSARRRDMQGIVKVSFTLLENGDIDDLFVVAKYKLLQLAAKTAVLDSLPFQEPPMGLEFPIKINYSMAFKLN